MTASTALTSLLVSRSCRGGRLLDSFGHHRAACSRAGVLGRRGYAVESVGARIFRACARSGLVGWCLTCMMGGAWRLWSEGLPLFGGVQPDTTLVSPRGDRSRPNCAIRRCGPPGCKAPQGAYVSSWWGPRAHARLVACARRSWFALSGETLTCLRLLAEAKSRSEPPSCWAWLDLRWRA